MNVQCVKFIMTIFLVLLSMYKYDVWNHRTGKPMTLQALSAGTSLTLCGVAPVAAHCSVLELIKNCHTETTAITSHITDLLYTHSSHGWFSRETGLEVAQDFLHTLSKHSPSIIPCSDYTYVVNNTMKPTAYLVNVI